MIDGVIHVNFDGDGIAELEGFQELDRKFVSITSNTRWVSRIEGLDRFASSLWSILTKRERRVGRG
jgi:hypothetical protein